MTLGWWSSESKVKWTRPVEQTIFRPTASRQCRKTFGPVRPPDSAEVGTELDIPCRSRREQPSARAFGNNYDIVLEHQCQPRLQSFKMAA